MKALFNVALLASAILLVGCGGGGGGGLGDLTGPIPLRVQNEAVYGANGLARPDVSKLLRPLEQVVSMETAGVVADVRGRVTVVGQFSGDATQKSAFVARFLADGSPDLSCGRSGVALLFPVAAGESMGQLKARDDGSYLAVRHNSARPIVAIGADCQVDLSFGVAGSAQAPSSVGDVRDFDVDQTGAVVAVSEQSVFRIHRSGQLDRAFGSNGELRLSFPVDVATRLDSVVVTADGSTIVGFMARYGAGAQQRTFIGATRVLPGGVLDTGYGQQGWLSTKGRFEAVSSTSQASVAALPDNSTVLAWGGLLEGRGQVAVLMKADSLGRMVEGFGANGLAQWTVGSEHTIHERVVTDGSDLVVCGDTNPSGVPDRQAAYVLRLNASSGAAGPAVGIRNHDVPSYGQGDSGFFKNCRGLTVSGGRPYVSVGVSTSGTRPAIVPITF